ncbi:MAG: alpha/beta fold hydrolase [Microcoleus sp. PH2017_01_SCD_O_A]|uniref:alpha/beta fold hydrolase n=1 Tax=unclassified Microcoleus TaxID=2642155 RepID=UPI001D58A325|nr:MULTISPECIES: alpha/beta fold hydrolase [unclassified Microcoleus]MCC3510076.1 alpha/beta fold hydrolase [Microcoleus sp. PH2017_17_BER_D_A]TAE39136.1 MAG: alpha/beta fold hydrolase [Oscillatoriales cyanobacterium]MCC3426072.1 alpha/beta fold hydrolase [Microcoleus sp. PH2017_01_SCD_O_A]MCC3447526.1 alpha/beta fold hydrolase [Microcoleus sp. PH2017_09_SFU_O_A]MCC3473180.1 alpha/beta fold hydrolase [Microcoleus sp. PH2017_13_LAR_U_A]
MHIATVTGPAGRLNLTDTGAASSAEAEPIPVLFVHGMAYHLGVWDETIALLRANLGQNQRILAIDLRGHGASEPPADGDYTPDSCATDIIAILDALNIPQVALVGHSFGSLVVLATADCAPTRITRVILADPPGDFNYLPPSVYEEQMVPFLAALAGDSYRAAAEEKFSQALDGGTTATRETTIARLAATPRDRLIGMYKGMFAYDAVGAIDRILATPGTQISAVLAPANSWPFSLHILRPQIATTVIPETSHWLQLDAPVPFAEAVTNQLTVDS